MLRNVLTVVIFSISLAGCQTVRAGGCPTLPAYSVTTQKEAAAALRGLPKGSPLARMIVDYGKVRDACRI